MPLIATKRQGSYFYTLNGNPTSHFNCVYCINQNHSLTHKKLDDNKNDFLNTSYKPFQI